MNKFKNHHDRRGIKKKQQSEPIETYTEEVVEPDECKLVNFFNQNFEDEIEEVEEETIEEVDNFEQDNEEEVEIEEYNSENDYSQGE